MDEIPDACNISHEDLQAALKEMKSYVDITVQGTDIVRGIGAK